MILYREALSDFYKCRLPWQVYANKYRKRVDKFVQDKLAKEGAKVDNVMVHRRLVILDDPLIYLLAANEIPLP